MKAWATFNYKFPTTKGHVLAQYVWYTSALKQGGNYFFVKKMEQMNVNKFQDIYDTDNKKFSKNLTSYTLVQSTTLHIWHCLK